MQQNLPLALALTLAFGAMAAGCAQDAPPVTDAQDGAPAAVHHDEAHADAHGEDAHGAHHHDFAEAAGVDFPVPADHVRWEPDAPLIEGMSRVRTALAGLDHGDAGQHPDDAGVAARAADIDAAIDYMFANCSLDTEPDVALHAILARLMAGTQALHADPAGTAPVADMQAAMDNYRQLFNDPGADAAA